MRKARNILIGALALCALVLGLPAGPTDASVTVVTGLSFYAAGDIACHPGDTVDSTHCQMAASANIIRNDADFSATDSRVLPIGDQQYDNGTSTEFSGSYDITWGANPTSGTAFKSISKPVIGNHEYGDTTTPGPAQGYQDYWTGQAKWNQNCISPATGCAYYSYDLGGWHIVALNTECDQFTGAPSCAAENTWLAADLAASDPITTPCELIYGHRPRWARKNISGNGPGNNGYLGTMWGTAVSNGVDLWVSGHTHNYQRYPLMDANGNSSSSGTREIVVGSGGEDLNTVATSGGPPAAPTFTDPTAGATTATDFGVLKLILGTNQYSTTFLGIGNTVLEGTANKSCHT